MSRKLTTYKRPSIATMIATAPHVLALAALRREIAAAIRRGEIDPSEGTRRDWANAVWLRVIELVLERPTEATFVHNTVMSWEAPPSLREAFLAIYRKVVAQTPSPAEILRRRGIIIVGVTG